MSQARKWTDEADLHMAQMQQLWNSISSPKSPAAPKRTTRSTLIPISAETPEGLERKARAKERSQRKALELEQNRKRMQEHHRNLKNMRSPWAEGRHRSPAPVTTPSSMQDASSQRPSQLAQDTNAARKSYEQQSIEFQSARRALRKSLNGSTTATPDINIEFILPKAQQQQQQQQQRTPEIRSTDNRSAIPSDVDRELLAHFGEQHDLRPVRRLLKY